MPKETRSYQITAWIKDSDGQIKELSKRQELTLDWEKKEAVLNPGPLRTFESLGKKCTTRDSQGQIITFEKDGKQYKFNLELKMAKGLLKDHFSDLSLLPIKGADYVINKKKANVDGYNEYLEPDKHKKVQRSWGFNIEPKFYRTKGVVILSISALAIISLLIGSIVYFIRKKQIKLRKTNNIKTNYYMSLLEKTIVSLVTLPVNQNIALIRISGRQTYEIIAKIFDRRLPPYPQKESKLIFGNIINVQKKIVDQVLLLCFYKPKSLTGEDVVEISCHGNLFIVNEILSLILSHESELANPGEFSKQAFFNGKLNLIQAQAINDLIRAPSLSATKLALHNLSNETKKVLENIEDELFSLSLAVFAKIEKPEYDQLDSYLEKNKINSSLNEIIKKIKSIQENGKKAQIYQTGLKVAIVGKPNVGKSTLLNNLIKKDKSIVSSVAGTTRDVIEADYFLKGVPLILLDTAGICETKDKIEKIGIKKSYRTIKESEIIFFLTDNSQAWSKEDEIIWKTIKKTRKKFLILVNKTDKSDKKLQIPLYVSSPEHLLKISAKKKQLDELENWIGKLFLNDLVNNLPFYPILSQSWQQAKLIKIIENFKEIEKNLEDLALIWQFTEESCNLIKELKGKKIAKGELLDNIFNQFCIGK